MEQLTGLDASFLYLETRNSPMHISGLYLYTQETAPGGKVRFKDILEFITSRVQRLPTMAKRLKRVPLDLDHPYWVDDGDFDPEYHIRHVRLPAPGDWRQLCIMVSRIHARPLDRERPLWEMYVIEGLDNVEGCPPGASRCSPRCTTRPSTAPRGWRSPPRFTTWNRRRRREIQDWRSGEKEPGALNLLMPAPSATRCASPCASFPWPATRCRALREGLHACAAASSSASPRCRARASTAASRPYRVFTGINVPLADVKAIKNAVEGATVNDVAIAIVGGALRATSRHQRAAPQSRSSPWRRSTSAHPPMKGTAATSSRRCR
jgi:diacylglycerol O-acyltransferase